MADGDDKDEPGGAGSVDETIRRPLGRVHPGTRVGRYEIIDWIGGGSVGEVYRARDPTIGRTVALKLIQAERDPARRRSGEAIFRREAAAAGALVHANIVTLYDAGQDAEHYYLAMEFIDGITFAEEIRESGPLSPERIIEVGTTIAEALHFAHENGVIHRDVKPANLLILANQKVKLTDLGIARLTATNELATDGSFFGTPNYVSPEQIHGGDITGRADLFSLGVVLYEAVTGDHPFRRPNVAATLNAVLSAQPVPPHKLVPEVPRALSETILRAMEKDPQRRFETCADFAAALRSDAPGAPVARRTAVGWMIGLAAMAAGAGTAWWALGDRIRLEAPEGTAPPDSGEGPRPAGSGGSAALPTGSEDTPVTFGVMLFKPRGTNDDNEWMAEALRDSFNNQLSQLSGVKVYSMEFIDFVMKKKNLSELEAMVDLGVQKMLSGTFTIVEGEMQVDTYVVDVESGVLDTSYRTDGSVEEFFDLRNRILVAAVDRLDLPVSDAERRVLLAQRSGDVDVLRDLLEAEGASLSETPEDEEPLIPHGRLLFDLFGPTDAFASSGPDEDAILSVLESYRSATEQGDIAALEAIYDQYPEKLQAAQERYFARARDLEIEIEDVEMVVLGDEAVVSYTRSDEFVDTRTGRPVDASVRLTKTLVRKDGTWRLVPGK